MRCGGGYCQIQRRPAAPRAAGIIAGGSVKEQKGRVFHSISFEIEDNS